MITGASATKGERIDSRTLDSRIRRRVTARLMPFLFALYMIAYIDRINISFAGLQMTGELGFTDAVFGFGSGVFFFGYTLLAIPGAMLVEGCSARKIIAATMAIWGLVASATGFSSTSGTSGGSTGAVSAGGFQRVPPLYSGASHQRSQ